MTCFCLLLLVPFLRNADAFFFVSSTRVRLLPEGGRGSARGARHSAAWRHPEHTLRGTAEEGSAAHSTENAAAAKATPLSAAGPQATDELGPSHLVGAAGTTDGNSTPVPLRSAPTRAPRLYLGGSNLHEGEIVNLTTEQTRYLVSVMRLRDGSPVRVFDGVNGEFLAVVSGSSGRGAMNRARRSGVSGDQSVDLRVEGLIRRQPGSSKGQDVAAPDVELMFAPIRKQRLKLMVEKSVELGASRLTPVLTARTQKGAVSDPKALGKLGLVTAVEAAEQCERMTVPLVAETPVPLLPLLQDIKLQRSCRTRGSGTDAQGERDCEIERSLPETIFVCKERDMDAKPILEALAEYARDTQGGVTSAGDASSGNTPQNAEVAFLVGPEGGFDPDEMRAIAACPFVRFVSLGPLVLRAETAAMYALSSWSAFWAAQ